MHGRSGVIAPRRLTSQDAWGEPVVGGQLKHVRFIWNNRGGNSKTSGSGASGRKAKPARLLARCLADRAGINIVMTKRCEANRLAKTTPLRII